MAIRGLSYRGPFILMPRSKSSAVVNYRRAGEVDAPIQLPFTHRWYGKLALLSLSVLLLTLSFAPINQFYLAWVGLVPWLIVVQRCRSTVTAFLWSWLGGTM